MALTTTVGGTTSDSYATVAEALTYFNKTGRADDWGQDEATQERFLFDAMVFIDLQGFIGSRATTDQALEWPRLVGGSFALSTALPTVQWQDTRGRYWTADEIPEPIKQAQCEMALALMQGFDDAADGSLSSFSADGVSVTFRGSASSPAKMPARALRFLAGFITGPRLLRA